MSELELLERRLDDHTKQDHENFKAIRETLEKIDIKLDAIAEKTIRLEVVQETAAKSGAMAGSRWSAIVAIVVAGIFQACNWINTSGS